MGIFNVHNILPFLWFFVLITTNYAQFSQTPLISPPPPTYRLKDSPFRPSIAVLVALLTTIFSVVFLLLLYAKHCKRGPFEITTTSAGPSSSFRKHSGIDRAVIESLPVFRFGALRGLKAEGLECAVCLNKFEPTDVLRLLPKCKHAFHVECVDTWLDTHSTSPLCRYQVDPEDILLENGQPLLERKSSSNLAPSLSSSPGKSKDRIYATGRHSSAGERGSSSLQIIVETPKEQSTETTSFLNTRMSLDSWSFYRKKLKPSSTRKDGLLLLSAPDKKEVAEEPPGKRRLEHRIIISGDESRATSASRACYRWSDVGACDMLYLRSEMILSESRRYYESRIWTAEMGSGRRVIKERSVSEMTGMSRFRSKEEEREIQERQRQRRGTVTRWLGWISQSQSQSHIGLNNI